MVALPSSAIKTLTCLSERASSYTLVGSVQPIYESFMSPLEILTI